MCCFKPCTKLETFACLKGLTSVDSAIHVWIYNIGVLISSCITVVLYSYSEETPKAKEKPGWIPQTDSGKGVELQSYEQVASTPVASVSPMPVSQDGRTRSPKPAGNGNVSEDSGSDSEDDSKAPVMHAVAVLPTTVGPPPYKGQQQRESTRRQPAVRDPASRTSSLRREAPPVAPKPKERSSIAGFPARSPPPTTPAPRPGTTTGLALDNQTPVSATSLPRRLSAGRVPTYSIPDSSRSLPRRTAAIEVPRYETPVSTAAQPRLRSISDAPSSETPAYVNGMPNQPSVSTNQAPAHATPLGTASLERFRPLKKRMSQQEKDMLDSMIDELASSPASSQEHPPGRPPPPASLPLQNNEPSPGIMRFDMQRLLGSESEEPSDNASAWSPPRPPPPSEDFPVLPPENLPAHPRELQDSSPEPEKPSYSDDVYNLPTCVALGN